mmetsp:Transcript_41033/g.67222  ORF Transcript_41033/g.67222 Transcript_41033/m.67222 type:complete len:97 (-) Transcript_41033:10-300(-)
MDLPTQSYWRQTERQLWLRRTKEALFIRAENPGKKMTQLMNLDHGLIIIAHAGTGHSRNQAKENGKGAEKEKTQTQMFLASNLFFCIIVILIFAVF